MCRLQCCKLTIVVGMVALAACQSEPIATDPAPKRPFEPIFPISGTFAFARTQWLTRSGRFGASVVWYHERATREIADAATRLLQEPALSPDGVRLIVNRVDNLTIEEFGEFQLGRGDLFLNNAVATSDALVPLTATGSASSPDWSPDGQRVVFVSGLSWKNHIYVLPASGGAPVRVSAQEGSYQTPRWSPDGRRLVFTDLRDGKRDIFVMNADGSALLNLTPDDWSEASPNWSPTGTRIAFSSARGSRLSQIFTVDPDGKNLTRLTPELGGSSEQPVWSPDGLQIAFAFSMYQSDQYSPAVGSGIYVIDAAGSHLRQLTAPPLGVFDRHPTWSR